MSTKPDLDLPPAPQGLRVTPLSPRSLEVVWEGQLLGTSPPLPSSSVLLGGQGGAGGGEEAKKRKKVEEEEEKRRRKKEKTPVTGYVMYYMQVRWKGEVGKKNKSRAWIIRHDDKTKRMIMMKMIKRRK